MKQYLKTKFKEIEQVYGTNIALQVLFNDIKENLDDIQKESFINYENINKYFEKYFLTSYSKQSFKDFINNIQNNNSISYSITDLDKCLNLISKFKQENIIFISNNKINNIFKVIAHINSNNFNKSFTYTQFENFNINEFKDNYNIIFLDDNIEIIPSNKIILKTM